MILAHEEVRIPDERAGEPRGTAAERPKILFMIDEMSAITAGGTERQFLQLIAIARKSGLAPQVCVFRGTDWLTEDVTGCPVRRFEIGGVFRPAGLRRLRAVTAWMREERFDILHAFFTDANIAGPWMARRAGIPVVLGTRRNLNLPADRRFHHTGMFLQRISNRWADSILVNSQAVLERIVVTENTPREKLELVYNGIDLEGLRPEPGARAAMRRRLGIGESQVLVGNISGLRPVKGVTLFVEAAEEVCRRHPEARFVLVGDGELEREITEMVRERGMERVFLLPGAAEDVRPYLAAMDIAVLCSSAEGFSNSLLEYMAAGLAIVATDVGGNREALEDAGILVPPSDAAELAAGIEWMMEGKRRQLYGARARQGAGRFGLDKAERKMADLYWSWLEKKGRHPGREGVA